MRNLREYLADNLTCKLVDVGGHRPQTLWVQCVIPDEEDTEGINKLQDNVVKIFSRYLNRFSMVSVGDFEVLTLPEKRVVILIPFCVIE